MCQQEYSAAYACIFHDHHSLRRYIPFALNDHMIKFVFMHLETIDRIQFVRQYANADKVHKVQRQILHGIIEIESAVCRNQLSAFSVFDINSRNMPMILINDFLSMLIPFISFHLSSVPLCSHSVIETIYIS